MSRLRLFSSTPQRFLPLILTRDGRAIVTGAEAPEEPETGAVLKRRRVR